MIFFHNLHRPDKPGVVMHIMIKCLGNHYTDVTMSAMASQIISVSIVYSTVGPGADQRKQQSSASLAFAWGIQRWSVSSPHKRPVTRKVFPFDDVIVISCIWHSEWNHSIYQIHYTGVTWALWRLESVATLLTVQQLLQVNKYEDKLSILPALCEGNPPVTSCSPNKGQVTWKVIEIVQKILGNKTFFWWPILLTHMHYCMDFKEFTHIC